MVSSVGELIASSFHPYCPHLLLLTGAPFACPAGSPGDVPMAERVSVELVKEGTILQVQ